MTTYTKITVPAAQYADHDDCLAAAAREFAAEHGLADWDLSPDWLDDDRDHIVLTVPVTRYEITTGPEHHNGERPWMRLASTVTVEAKGVGARCSYRAATTDAGELEAALEADGDVIEYRVEE